MDPFLQNITVVEAYELGREQERERVYQVIANWTGFWLDHARPTDILAAIQPE